MTSYWDRILRGLGVLTVLVFGIAAFTPASNSIGNKFEVTGEPRPADAIVVLGAGLRHGGVMSDESMRRLIRGIELYKEGFAPVLVLSGPGRPDAPRPTEAEVRAILATKVGIQPNAVVKEETATTTREESIHIAATLLQRNTKRILLVTDSLHMRRAKRVFERAGLDVAAAPSADYPNISRSPEDRLWLTMRLLQETAALTYYRVAGYL